MFKQIINSKTTLSRYILTSSFRLGQVLWYNLFIIRPLEAKGENIVSSHFSVRTQHSPLSLSILNMLNEQVIQTDHYHSNSQGPATSTRTKTFGE